MFPHQLPAGPLEATLRGFVPPAEGLWAGRRSFWAMTMTTSTMATMLMTGVTMTATLRAFWGDDEHDGDDDNDDDDDVG